MVKIRDNNFIAPDGKPDLISFFVRMDNSLTDQDKATITTIYDVVLAKTTDIKTKGGHGCLVAGFMIAEILNHLQMDNDSVIAGILYPALNHSDLTILDCAEFVPKRVIDLIQDVLKLELLEDKNLINICDDKISPASIHNALKMLLTVVNDVRVLIVKLAIKVFELRDLVKCDSEDRYKLALITQHIYAPLANRLGIGQIKWELEDLSFRYLEPEIYKSIAKLLDARRIDREKYIDKVISELNSALKKLDIKADIWGRAKHIFSIWRKMQRKRIGYNKVYDTLAIRVIVDDLETCYAALGVVHTLWQHIPKEFDDYIACPKANGYKSLHTAVVGPEGKVIEVQIRTEKMHMLAELGVASHWKYKEGGGVTSDYDVKLNNLRQLINWQDEGKYEEQNTEDVMSELFGDRIYVFTPNGDVVDLPKGATALDFAYHIHTDIGHRCRGARVNGSIITLTQSLQSGNMVEILTSKDGAPSRDWLNPQLNYIKSSRARAKILTWFKKQHRDEHIAEGREILAREGKRLGISLQPQELLKHFKSCRSVEDLLAAIGCGDIRSTQVVGVYARNFVPKNLPLRSKGQENAKLPSVDASKVKIHVLGLGNLLSHMAKCCDPNVGDEIIGYITRGEGVAVHRKDCENVLQARQRAQERLIEVSWGMPKINEYETEIIVKAYNRGGLLKDISIAVDNVGASVVAVTSTTDVDENISHFQLKLEVKDIAMLSAILNSIQQIMNVTEVYAERS